ncbi:neural cell adhesion molecule 2-like [Pecten maximus]|uniref:neural cell adhesion molecule 2-like n=1 Tax=Pecten maximus TaxID=6579 RepID=UPI0014586D0C|nr:neural cell adhesion molecule 2-like [Pecten maximus]
MAERIPVVLLFVIVLLTCRTSADPPDIATFNILSGVFYEGDDVFLDCTIDGGTPLATLTWGRCVDQSGESSESRNTANKSVERLTIQAINRTYNYETCTCTASHPEITNKQTLTKVLTVYYPPAVPDLLVDTSNGGRIPWLADPSFTGSLRCRIHPGNPDFTEIIWYNNGAIDPYRSGEYRIFDPPDKIYHGRNFTCRAQNRFTTEKGTIIESNGIVLDIEYTPVITLHQSEAYVNETMPFNQTCSAVGNPTPTVRWSGVPHKGSNDSEAVLQFNATDRADTNTYFCTASSYATNSFLPLSSMKSLLLYVQHGPDDITLNVPEQTTENATHVQLRCIARSLPASKFKWTHWIGTEFIRETFDNVTDKQLTSTLTLNKVTYQDMGTYRCEAENGFKGRDGQLVYSQSAVVNIRARPRVIDAQDTYIVEKNDALDVNITFYSFPKPLHLSITKTDSDLPSTEDLNIMNTSVPITLPFYNKFITADGYFLQLQFRSVHSQVEGQYQLFVNNTFPYFYPFQIVISDKPDAPQLLDIDTRSRNHDRAVVTWLPGNNGGHKQNFTLTYTKQNSDIFLSLTTNHTTSSVRLKNLQQFTTYEITLFARNLKGESDHVYGTFTTEGKVSQNAAILGGVIGGVIALLLIVSGVVVVVCIYQRHRSHVINRFEYEMAQSGDTQ